VQEEQTAEALPHARGPIGSKRVMRAVQIVVTTVVVGFFLFAIYNALPDILSYQWEFNFGWLSLALVLIFVRGPIGVQGYWEITKTLGYPLPWLRTLRIVLYSTFAGFVPGGMWHAVSRVYLAEREGVPRVITGVGVLIESALVALGAALIAPLAALAWPQFPLWVMLGALLFLCGFVVAPNLLFRLLDWLLVKLKRTPTNVRLTPADMLRMLWPFTLNWALFGIMSFALIAAIYPSLAISNLPAIMGVHISAWLLGYLAVFVPQGLVVREAVIVGFLAGVLGLPVAVATAAALLNRLWSMLGLAIWGAIATRV
jgi:glycosyltransferase 2 family protein